MHVSVQKEELQATGADPAGLRTNTGFLPCHIHTLTPPPQGEEGKAAHTWGHQPIPPDSLGTAVMPATVKEIHKKGPEHIQSCQPYMVLTSTHFHSPKRDERKNKCVQACEHRRRSDRLQGRSWADRITCPGCGGGGSGTLAKPHIQSHFTPEPDRPSPWSQFLSQNDGPQEALM
jgi:hypothetical protein